MKRGDKQQTVAKERFICYILEVSLSFYMCINPILDALWYGKVHHVVTEVIIVMQDTLAFPCTGLGNSTFFLQIKS